jgi:beta-lactamase class A
MSDFAAIEAWSGGQLGVAALDLADNSLVTHRGAQLFPMCSTFKVLASALVLRRADIGEDRLDRLITYGVSDLVPFSPFTERHAGGTGLTLEQLCEATITLSDNTAANLILRSFGGPAGLTAFLRSIGDTVTRLDRMEPELNNVQPGDTRDTTSPSAMAATLASVLFGNVLSNSGQGRLQNWMISTRTGDRRLRAGLAGQHWVVGDKTGTSRMGHTNDVAFAVRPGRPPLVITAFLADSPLDLEGKEEVLAEVGRLVAEAVV